MKFGIASHRRHCDAERRLIQRVNAGPGSSFEPLPPPEQDARMRDAATELRKKATEARTSIRVEQLRQTYLNSLFNDGVFDMKTEIAPIIESVENILNDKPLVMPFGPPIRLPDYMKSDVGLKRFGILSGWITENNLLERRYQTGNETGPDATALLERLRELDMLIRQQVHAMKILPPGAARAALEFPLQRLHQERGTIYRKLVAMNVPFDRSDRYFLDPPGAADMTPEEQRMAAARQAQLDRGSQPYGTARAPDSNDLSPGYRNPLSPWYAGASGASTFPNNYGLGPKWGNVGPINIRPAHDGRQEYASPDVQEVLRAYEAIPKADYPQMAEANPQFKPFIDAVWREHYKIDQDKETWIVTSPKRREWVHNLNNARRGLLKLIEGGVIPKGAQPTMAYLMAVDSVSAARGATAGTRIDSPLSSLDRPYPLPLKTIRVNAKDKGYMYSGATTHITGYGPVDSFGERKRYEFLYNPYRNAANEGSTMSAAKAALGISVGPADAAGQFDISFMRPGTFEVDGRPVTVEGAESAPVPVERPKEREGLPLQFQYVSFGSELPRMIKVKRGRETVDMNISEMQPGTVRYFDKGINVLNDARHPGWYKINFYEPGRYEVEGIFDRDGSRAFASTVDVVARTAPNAMASRPNQEALQQELARVRSELDAVRKEKGEVTDQVKKLVDQIQALQKQLNSISG